MFLEEFKLFRIVGGTSLSLQVGHRESVDIDLFTDAKYNSVDFEKIEKVLKKTFNHVESPMKPFGMGATYYIGNGKNEKVKLDLFYTDTFVFPIIKTQNIRLASIEEIIAMKLDVIARGGRKKDFWDIHELLEIYSLDKMLDFYEKRYPYNYTKEEVRNNLTNFQKAESDFEPNCYRGKYWKIIKFDFEWKVEKLRQDSGC